MVYSASYIHVIFYLLLQKESSKHFLPISRSQRVKNDYCKIVRLQVGL